MKGEGTLSSKIGPEKPYIPTKLIVLIPLAPSGLFLLGFFLGVGWGMLFVTLLHLLFGLVPISAKLGRFLLGQTDYTRMQNTLQKTAKSRVYRATFIFSNVALFVFVGVLLRMNIRVMDLIK